VKFKATYTYVEQLYTGGVYAIMAADKKATPPPRIKDMLNELSIVSQWIQELVKSVARARIGMVLAHAKAFLPKMDRSEMVGGFPQFKVDVTKFSPEDFVRCVKETQVAATQMVDELDLSKYLAGYTEENKRINLPEFKPLTQTPPRRKQTFTPDVDPSAILTNDSTFQALSTIHWMPRDLQTGQDESAQADPEAIGAEGQHGEFLGSSQANLNE
jgi:hypothetical protein